VPSFFPTKKNPAPAGEEEIEKRKLREKRRSTGVFSIPSNESLDELEDDDGGDRERKMEQQLVQANTVQNESMTPSPGSPESPGPPGHLLQVRPPPSSTSWSGFTLAHTVLVC
jgi:hypothetical protein